MSKISLMFTIKAVEHFFKHWYYSGSVLWSRRKCDSWQEVMRVRDSRWENILGEDWELESPCLGNFWRNSVLVLRTWSQWLMLAQGHWSLSPSDGHLPIGGETLWLLVLTGSASYTEQVARTCCQQGGLFLASVFNEHGDLIRIFLLCTEDIHWTNF